MWSWNDLGVSWWRDGVARFFDGYIWPTPAGLLPWEEKLGNGMPGEYRYPEEYNGWSLYTAGAEASALWHWAENTGWSLDRISSWMKNHQAQRGRNWDLERKALSTDFEMVSLFHSYGRAAVLGVITYARSEWPVKTLPKAWGAKQWNSRRWFDPITVKTGEDRELSSGLSVDSWTVVVAYLSLTGGQVLNVSIRHRDYVVLTTWPHDKLENITMADNASIYRDMEWSYRQAGQARLTRVDVDAVGRITVPNSTWATDYEFVVTCTGGTYEKAPAAFRMRGVDG